VDARDKPGHDELVGAVRFYCTTFESDSKMPKAIKNARSNCLARLADESNAGTSLDFARCPWYPCRMTRLVRTANRKHMTRVCRAVEGVVR